MNDNNIIFFLAIIKRLLTSFDGFWYIEYFAFNLNNFSLPIIL